MHGDVSLGGRIQGQGPLKPLPDLRNEAFHHKHRINVGVRCRKTKRRIKRRLDRGRLRGHASKIQPGPLRGNSLWGLKHFLAGG